MNLSISGYNFTSNISSYNSVEGASQCLKGNTYSLECIYNTICPQFNSYFIKTGLIILIIIAVISWLKWWFFKYGYKYINYDSESSFHRYIGNLQLLENRQYWDNWINSRMFKVMYMFIVIVVYLSYANRI